MLGAALARFLHPCRLVLALAAAILLGLSATAARADGHADVGRGYPVPEALKPWEAWVLDGATTCPTFFERADQSRCAWPARLDLVLGDKGGTFIQSWHVDALASVPLPGDAKRWPVDVKVDGKDAVVVTTGGSPSLQLAAGEHSVRGGFVWDSLPESLAVPRETGLLTLTLRGAVVAAPSRDLQGTVWFQKAPTNEEGDSLGVVVHRMVTDDIPLRLVTRIELHVSGKSREELLGRALPPDFVPMALEAPLPARVEPDGRIRVQVRPGVFTLQLTARTKGPVASLTRPKPEGGPWKEGDEVWVFEAKNDYRVVSVEGVTSIDPQQTTLPDAWRRLPAYPMAVGATMRFNETRRGDADPPPDQLTLARSLWLDFDGHGYTVQDTLTGSLNRASRLTMAAPTVLGRVAIRGRDQFITTIAGQGGAGTETGIEVRQGDLSVTADSRIGGTAEAPVDVADIPAVGWAHDFHQVTGTLHLPPGWSLLFATGVDDVPGTWVRHWTLLEIFLALMIGIVIGRLYGVGWGAVSLLMLVVTLPEAGAPKWCWVAVLVLEALVRVMPTGRPRKLFEGARLASFAIVSLVAVPFVVAEVRQGLHPALRESELVVGSGGIARDEAEEVTILPMAKEEADGKMQAVAAAPAPSAATEGDLDRRRAGAGGAPGSPLESPAPAKKAPADAEVLKQKLDLGASSRQVYQSNSQVYDPAAIVQTGPGLPRWSWSTIELRWSGPVAQAQRLHLYLLSPRENLALALLRSALLLLVVLRLIPASQRILPRFFGAGPTATAAALTLLAAMCGLAPREARADIPDKAMLDDLKARLLRAAPCTPTCASSGRMAIDLRGNTLRLRVEIDAAATTAVPLPGKGAQWSPADVRVDGKPAASLVRVDDVLWVALDAGVHQVILEGAMPDRASLQLSLPMKPHHVEASAVGWSVAGIHEDGLSDDDLQFTRTEIPRAGAGHSEAQLQPGTLPPFATITRTLHVGLDWEMETEVTRTTPVGSAVVLEVPLLAGERVTTADVRVVAGKAQVFLGPDATALAWRSVLAQTSPIHLVAGKDVAWTEVWRMDIGSVWHPSYSGIPFVHATAVGGTKVPEWRPWPGEEGVVALTRPHGVTGQTLTIDESSMLLRPGLRATDVTLTLNVRSSRGGDHTVTLPEGAQLELLSINGATQPIRQEGRGVTFPVVPGAQRLDIKFRVITLALTTVFTSPVVDVGAPSVNATVSLEVPSSRWLLFTFGPRVGPAVLFWSLLIVLLVVAAALGQNRWTPLRAWHWALLFVGLSQVDVVAGGFFVGWLLALGWRGRDEGSGPPPGWYNLRQVVLVAWTVAALVILGTSLHHGLLGAPEMQVTGNGSSSGVLRWFADRVGPGLPVVRIISVPLLVYRGAMLAWALWIVLSLLAWLRWGWGAFTRGGGWKKRPPRAPRAPASPLNAPPGPPMPEQTLAYAGVSPASGGGPGKPE